MESLKGGNKSNFLFKCAEVVITQESKYHLEKLHLSKREQFPEEHSHLVHEFFTGFIPVITFVAFQDKWCQYFKCDKETLLENFLDSFEKSHLYVPEGICYTCHLMNRKEGTGTAIGNCYTCHYLKDIEHDLGTLVTIGNGEVTKDQCLQCHWFAQMRRPGPISSQRIR